MFPKYFTLKRVCSNAVDQGHAYFVGAIVDVFEELVQCSIPFKLFALQLSRHLLVQLIPINLLLIRPEQRNGYVKWSNLAPAISIPDCTSTYVGYDGALLLAATIVCSPSASMSPPDGTGNGMTDIAGNDAARGIAAGNCVQGITDLRL